MSKHSHMTMTRMVISALQNLLISQGRHAFLLVHYRQGLQCNWPQFKLSPFAN